MTILDEVRRWARDQNDWQREAVARLDEKVSLDQSDDDDLYAILKSARGIEDPQGRVPRAPEAAPNIRIAQHGDAVNLLAIQEVRNVNALAKNGSLTFAPAGLTVVYGSNGSGKSGYARVLKQACFARDKREKVLPNTNLPRDQGGVPSAELLASVGETEVTFTWNSGDVEVSDLNRVSVFDHTCARAFVENEGDFAYAPAGLDILADLGAACGRMRTRLQREIEESAPNIEPLRALSARTSTSAGKIAAALPGGASEAQVAAAAGLNQQQAERLEMVLRAVSAPDPAAQAAAFRHQALRVKAIADAITTALSIISTEKVRQLRSLVDSSNEAKAAAELAARAFNDTAGQLPQTGGDLWRTMFEAAREFAATSEPVRAFPHLHVGSICPLCQQDLGEPATERLAAFERFVKGEAQRKAELAKEAAATAYKQLREASIDLGLTPPIVAELKAFSDELAASCDELQRQLTKRKASILAACGKACSWDEVPEAEGTPLHAILKVVADLNEQAASMDAAADKAKKNALNEEREELEARRLLGELKDVALSAIEKHAHQKKLQTCIADVATQAITRKSTELTNNLATEQLMDALNAELAKLNIANLQVVMRAEGERGRASYKLMLERPGKFAARDVLSEGEQRAVAIASFLTERRLSGDGSGVIFDDPVCSLDHRRRQRVARRLALEAEIRQVIVFTHDMFFLFALMEEAEKLGIQVAPRTVSQTQEGFGVSVNELPFDGSTTKARVGWLRDKQVSCARLHRNGEEVPFGEEVGRLYTKLREAWEGCVEEMLLNGTVERFRKSVETNRLTKVDITDSDITKVVENMGRCSNYAHNVARRGDVEMPTPAEIAADIQVLEDWRKELDERRKKTKRA